MHPKFSIQVCCYNSQRYLDETIKSILAQTFKDWELVIVNDGSTDATESIIKKYMETGLPIVYFYQENKGFAHARNKAVRLSRGEWVAILDHDDIWHPEKLEIQNVSTERFPQAKLHFSNSEWFDDEGRIVRRTITDNKFKTGLVSEPFLRLLAEGCFIDSETALINKGALIECGGFDERYAYIVDYDMFLRLAKRHDIYYEDRTLASWRMHSSQATRNMREIMAREYTDLFEDILKSADLPGAVRDKIKRSAVYHALNHSLFELDRKGFKAFLRRTAEAIKLRPMSPRTYLKVIQTFYRASAGKA